MKVMITGAAGFVGSHVVRHWLLNTDDELVLPVTMKHRGRWDRLMQQIDGIPAAGSRIHFLFHDLRSPFSDSELHQLDEAEVIVNVASESHVDRSIVDPVNFIESNVSLVLNMLELARKIEPRIFFQISTDEVYGPAYEDYRHREWDSIIPSNPYSASKACQEAIAVSYWRTYGVPVVLTNTMNIVGEMQDPEKFVPKTIRHLTNREPVPVHVSPSGKSGSRFYLHARNQADALLFLTKIMLAKPPASYTNGDIQPDRFHIVGECEVLNDELVTIIARQLGCPFQIERVSFHASRPGHDLRYALDGTKLADLGWKPPLSLEESLVRTVDWTLSHPEWLR